MSFLYVKLILIVAFAIAVFVVLVKAIKGVESASGASDSTLPHANIALVCMDEELSFAISRLVTLRQSMNGEKEDALRPGHYGQLTSFDYHYCITLFENLEDYAKMQCSSATKVDGCIVVFNGEKLNVDEMRDLLKVTRLSGIESFLSYISVSKEDDRAEAEKQVAKLKEEAGFTRTSPVITSATILYRGATDKELCEELFKAVDSTIELKYEPEAPTMLFPIEDIFSIEGVGTIVTGRVERGTVGQGDSVAILGGTETIMTKVAGIEMFQRKLGFARAGDNVGIILKEIAAEILCPGMVLATPDAIKCRTSATVDLYPFDSVSPELRQQIFKGYADCHIRRKEHEAKLEFANNVDQSCSHHLVTMTLVPPAVFEEGTLCLLSLKGQLIALAVVR